MKKEISQAWRDADNKAAPPFLKTWRAAERRYAARRQTYGRFASAAAIVAIVLVSANLRSPSVGQDNYIEAAELLGSTSWSAPSDVLLPEHQFDIYQDMPALIESTKAAGGSLL